MHFLLLYPLLIHLVSAVVQRPDTYVWLEQNSYICDLELTNFRNAMKFLTTEEAMTLKCDCGDPLETQSACAKKGTELPMCRKLPELCLREYMVLFTATENRLMQPLTTRDPNETTTAAPTTIATTTVAATPPTTTATTAPPTAPPTAPSTQRRQTINRPTIRPVNRSRPPFRPFSNRPVFPLRSRPAAQRGPQRVFTLENRFPTTTPRTRTRNRRPFPTPGPIVGRNGFRRPPFIPRERSRERLNRLPPRLPPAARSRERSREADRRPRPQQRTVRPPPRVFQQRPSFTSREVFVPRPLPLPQFEAPPPPVTRPRLPSTTTKPTTTKKEITKVFVPPPLPPQPETTTEATTTTTAASSTPAPATTTQPPETSTVVAITTTSNALFPKKKEEPEALASLDELSNVKTLITKLIKEMSGDGDPLEGLEKLFEQRKKDREARKSSKVSSSEQTGSSEVQQVQFRTVMNLLEEENTKKLPVTTVAPTTTTTAKPKPTTESPTTTDPMIAFLKQRIEQLESSLMQANKRKKIIKRAESPETSVNDADETSTISDINSFESSSELLESLLNNEENSNKEVSEKDETKKIFEKPKQDSEKSVRMRIKEDSNEARMTSSSEVGVHRRGSRSSNDSAQQSKQSQENRGIQEKESDIEQSHHNEMNSRERLRQIHEKAANKMKHLKPIYSKENDNSIENIEKRRTENSEHSTTPSPLNDEDVNMREPPTNKKNAVPSVEHRSDVIKQKQKVTADAESEEKLAEEAIQREINEAHEMESTTSLIGNNLRDSVLANKPSIQHDGVTPQPERKIYFTTSKFNARVCEDNHPLCEYWAFYKQCAKNAGYMYKYCRKACGICDYRFRL